MTTPHGCRRGFSAINSSSFSPTRIPTSTLLSVPREIRDDIIAHLLRAGDLAILRTSRKLYIESKERLYREGTFRFKMGFRDSYSGTYLPKTWIMFQSLHLHIFIGGPELEDMPVPSRSQLHDLRFLNLTLPNVIYPKRECRIVFDLGPVDPVTKRPLNTIKLRTVLPMLEPLVVFATVVVTFVPGQSELWPRQGMLMGKWEILRQYLARRLGPWKFISGTDGEEARLLFHPLEFCNSLAREEQVSEA